MKIGKTLKICRETKGISRAELANSIDMSVSYISLLENNKRDPNISTLEKISEALKIPTSLFLFLASDKSEFETIDSSLAEKLSLLTLKLIEQSSDKSTEVSE